MKALLAVTALLCAVTVGNAQIPATTEVRYCGPPARLADGTIRRRSDVVAAFRKTHPCPATGLRTGACSGWAIDHVIPLACGGCDAVGNLQWLPTLLKSASGTLPKDRWERIVYCIKEIN